MQEKNPIISGVQQMGIGIPNVHEAFKHYRQSFGINIPMFDEAAEANLMLPYTGGKPRSRHAILALSPQGGGGMEIWQYTSRIPHPPKFRPQLGDLGIYICKIKTKNVKKAYQSMIEKKLNILTPISKNPAEDDHYYVADRYDNIFEIVQTQNQFRNTKATNGGVYGAVIGVSDIEKSLPFYQNLLGYDEILSDTSATHNDLKGLPASDQPFRRVILTHSQERKGSFSKMLGSSQIELIQNLGNNRQPKKIFENRLWGDLGFIHLCFDIKHMDAMREKCAAAGHPFTVDSQADRDVFDMGDAAGNFSYIEDPDGTLIEFVETLKIPILKKLDWYLDLTKRNPQKPLPSFMLKALAFNQIKD